MQYEIEIQNIPNQTFSVTLNDLDMEITLKLAGGIDNQIMLFSLQVEGSYLCPAVPVFANQGILPYEYMISEIGGNFMFVTNNGEYPNYKNFGNMQSLMFITQDELING